MWELFQTPASDGRITRSRLLTTTVTPALSSTPSIIAVGDAMEPYPGAELSLFQLVHALEKRLGLAADPSWCGFLAL